MGDKNGLDKASYIMLGVPVLIAAICAVLTIGAAIWGIIAALGDSEGGGWLLFIMFLLGIVVVPCFVCWIVQCKTYISGLRSYIENKVLDSRKKGMKSAVASVIGNGILLFWGLRMIEPEIGTLGLLMIVLPALQLAILGIVVIMLRINVKRNRQGM